MENLRFALSRRQRRRTEIPAAIMTVLLCGLPWLADWHLGLFLSAIWLIPALCIFPRDLYGSTELTESGLRLRTPYRHRLIPWDQITGFTAHETDLKGGPRKTVLAHRTSGRPLPLPGLRVQRSQSTELHSFAVRLGTIQDYQRWISAR